jgi:hypothetical protein
MKSVRFENEAREAIQNALREIVFFVTGEQFASVIDEIYALPEADRATFVENILLDKTQLSERGISPPDDMIIQRSAFSDGRPTLFCVTKLVPEGCVWKKVTVTFDNPQAGVTAQSAAA